MKSRPPSRPFTREDWNRINDLRSELSALEGLQADQMATLADALTKAGLMSAGPPPAPGTGPGQWLARVAAHAEIIRDALEPWDTLTRLTAGEPSSTYTGYGAPAVVG